MTFQIKPRLIVFFIVLLALISGIVIFFSSHKTQQKSPVIIPNGAKEIQDDVYDLGETTDVNGEKVRKIMIIDEYETSESQNVKGVTTDVLQSQSTACPNPYIMEGGRAARNFAAHPLVYDSSNTNNISAVGILGALNRTVAKWEEASQFNFLDAPSSGTVPDNTADFANGKNEVFFAPILDANNPLQPSNSLAVTFSYIDPTGKINESDVAFNDTHRFSVTGEQGKFDYETVLLHEIGHVAGLAHTSGVDCQNTVMFPSIPVGLIRRDLTADDAEAAFQLYNPGAAKPGDINRDLTVNILDFQLLSNSFGKSIGQVGFNERADLNTDNSINILDFQILSNNFGR